MSVLSAASYQLCDLGQGLNSQCLIIPILVSFSLGSLWEKLKVLIQLYVPLLSSTFHNPQDP